MATFQLRIVTPEKVFFDGEVESVILRTTEGDVGILARHQQYLANLPAGPVKLKIDGENRFAAISNGVVKVSKEHTTILAFAIEWADEIDVEWAKRSQQDALDKKEHSTSEKEIKRAELKLQRALNRIRVSGMK